MTERTKGCLQLLAVAVLFVGFGGLWVIAQYMRTSNIPDEARAELPVGTSRVEIEQWLEARGLDANYTDERFLIVGPKTIPGAAGYGEGRVTSMISCEVEERGLADEVVDRLYFFLKDDKLVGIYVHTHEYAL